MRKSIMEYVIVDLLYTKKVAELFPFKAVPPSWCEASKWTNSLSCCFFSHKGKSALNYPASLYHSDVFAFSQ